MLDPKVLGGRRITTEKTNSESKGSLANMYFELIFFFVAIHYVVSVYQHRGDVSLLHRTDSNNWIIIILSSRSTYKYCMLMSCHIQVCWIRKHAALKELDWRTLR